MSIDILDDDAAQDDDPSVGVTNTLSWVEGDRQLIQDLKRQFNVESDRALETRLGIPASTISRVMTGKGPLNWEHRFVIRDKLAFAAVRNGVAFLLPKKLSKSLIAASHRQFLRGIEGEDGAIDQCLSIDEQIISTLKASCLPGMTNSFNALTRYRDVNNIPEGSHLSATERALIVETLVNEDSKCWASLIDNLHLVISTSESLADSISLKASTVEEETHKINELLDLIQRKFGIHKHF